MSMVAPFAEALRRSASFRVAESKAIAGEDVALAVPGVARPLIVASLFSARPDATLAVIAGAEAAERFARQCAAFLPAGAVLHLPNREVRPWERDRSDVETVGMRARAIHALERGKSALVVASARALAKTLPPLGSQVFDPLVLEAGAMLDLEEALNRLVRMGYERAGKATERGLFAIRGGILDVFPSEAAYPVRVDLFGDEVESVRKFVSSTGQLVGDAGAVEVFPCREVRLGTRAHRAAERELSDAAKNDDRIAHDLELMREGISFNGVERYLPLFYEKPSQLTDYISPSGAIVVIEPRSLLDDAVRHREELETAARLAHAKLDGLYLEPGDIDLSGRRRVSLLSLLRAGTGVDGEIVARRPEVAGGEERMLDGLRALADSGHRTVFAVRDEQMRRKVADILASENVPHTSRAAEPGFEPGIVTLMVADLPAGFVVPEAGLAVVSVDDAFPRTRRAQAADTGPAAADISFDYGEGDYVVHATHGIARCAGTVRKDVLGVERDYLLLEYAAGDRLYVPFEQLERVSKYVGPDSTSPRLTRLNTADWSRALGRARKAAKTLAFDLVELYARRSMTAGFAFGQDTAWQREMEDAFPFEETEDQLAAIAAVKADMESERPMDRLVAGDVGYGKTEIAIRAVFKAIQSGKQAMVLCPTTVLAQQHFTTFSERFEPFAVHVEVLSRFRTKAQQRAAVEGFATGQVDLLIGTHRLLSEDIVPKDLGLVVIDEEQRFGVGHKEHFKHLREQIDVLTLSATPIPRTLRMALSGVRNLTVIDTPPAERFPVDVHVGEHDANLAQAAIRAELERGGQVYYVHNRVKSIDDAAARVAEAVPEARVRVAHGQMSERELERIMESFSACEFDVLVATTIIESGLDNPHTNTLVIEDSQRLGLAQLYQLKGRVGRSHVRAHAYFFFPRGSMLTEEAYERLTALRDYSELGSGIKIAMRDLEIRGAGSLLGADQAGNLSAVGFELYAHMLKEAVAEARGEAVPPKLEVRVDVAAPAFLPEEYVPAVDERVRLYRRLAGSRTPEALERVISNLVSTYGELPPEAETLVAIAATRVEAAPLGIEKVALVKGRARLEPLALGIAQREKLREGIGLAYEERFQAAFLPLDRHLAPAAAVLEAVRSLASAM